MFIYLNKRPDWCKRIHIELYGSIFNESYSLKIRKSLNMMSDSVKEILSNIPTYLFVLAIIGKAAQNT